MQLAQPMEDAVPAESTFERAQTLGWCLTCLPQQGRRLACEMQVIRQRGRGGAQAHTEDEFDDF